MTLNPFDDYNAPIIEGEQHDAHVEAYDREMSWRSDQYWLSNGGSVVTECGTILHGDEM